MHQKHLLRFIKKKLKTEKHRYIDMYVRMCVYVCSGGGLEVGFVFSACSWAALVAGVGGYVLAGVEIVVLSRIFMYFGGC